MDGCHTFAFTHLVGDGKTYCIVNETMVQRVIDAVNMSVKEYADAWEFVRQGGLMNEEQAPVVNHPVAKAVFAEMLNDDHTEKTRMVSVRVVTDLARARGLELGLGEFIPA
jgi:hypothetical protein